MASSLEHPPQRELALPDSSSTNSKGGTHSVEDHKIEEKDHALDGADVEAGSGNLSQEHRDYLIARHGTYDLLPLPTMDPADPLNWPAWKV